ncbi:MAG: chemotaxis protein [Alphaproteobacteria bacterium]|nr:MAG: chemotaxis protein [Alphaproteobacteria bacterium]
MNSIFRQRSNDDFELSEKDFTKVAGILHRETGIFLPPSKRALVQSRLAKRVRMLGQPSISEYVKLIAGNDGTNELPNLISALTTNVTKFFREPHHFDDLRDNVLPRLVTAARAGGVIRLWSAGCSTGEEAYSLAFTILDVCPDVENLDVRILATDIDESALRRAREGQYTASEMKFVPEHIRRRFFTRSGSGETETWSVPPSARKLIAFRKLNLTAKWPFRGGFDAIFCRNVAIYFDEPTRQSLWVRFSQLQRRANDRLYIGHSERITGRAAGLYKPTGCATAYARLPARLPTSRATGPVGVWGNA